MQMIARKSRLQNDLLCVEWDIKLYTLTRSLTHPSWFVHLYVCCSCTGLPALATSGVIGYIAGYGCKQWARRYRANEDLAVWDYVAKHPEDFPELERRIVSNF